MDVLGHYDNGEVLDTANFLKYCFKKGNYYSYEAFVECICRIAVMVFNNHSLASMYTSITEKISMLIEMWNLDDDSLLTLHQEQRKQCI